MECLLCDHKDSVVFEQSPIMVRIIVEDDEAIAPSAIPRVLKEYREPWHEEFMPRTAWSLHNAFTEVLKEKAHLIPERSRILTSVFDRELGIA